MHRLSIQRPAAAGLLVIVCTILLRAQECSPASGPQQLSPATESATSDNASVAAATAADDTNSDNTADVSSSAPEFDTIEYIGLADKPEAWKPRASVVVRGEIRQSDGEQVAIIESDGSPRTIPSPQVVGIRPKWRTASAADAHQLFVERNYQAVTTAVPQALKSNLVQWQQRLLIAELVHATVALGKPREAGLYFLSLAKSNPPHLLYADMPLCWTVCEPDQHLQSEAQKWLSSSDESARLLGASWLLFGEYSAPAKQALAQLQTSTHSAISQIATLQGWRLTSPPQTMTQLERWLEYRDQLIPPLQLGPTEFLADRLMRIGQDDLALGQWLRIASQHSDRPFRAHQALLSASRVLKRLGREQEVQRLEAWIEKLAAQE